MLNPRAVAVQRQCIIELYVDLEKEVTDRRAAYWKGMTKAEEIAKLRKQRDTRLLEIEGVTANG